MQKILLSPTVQLQKIRFTSAWQRVEIWLLFSITYLHNIIYTWDFYGGWYNFIKASDSSHTHTKKKREMFWKALFAFLHPLSENEQIKSNRWCLLSLPEAGSGSGQWRLSPDPECSNGLQGCWPWKLLLWLYWERLPSKQGWELVPIPYKLISPSTVRLCVSAEGFMTWWGFTEMDERNYEQISGFYWGMSSPFLISYYFNRFPNIYSSIEC